MNIKTTIETFYYHRVDRWIYLRRENTKRSLAYTCVRWARKLGISTLPLDRAGYAVACIMRGPDYPVPCILKGIFTARIRSLVNIPYDGLGATKWRDAKTNNMGVSVLAMFDNAVAELKGMDKQEAEGLLHWSSHNVDACLHLGNYPFSAACDVHTLLRHIAGTGCASSDDYCRAETSLNKLLEHEITHPDTCWQLPKEWR